MYVMQDQSVQSNTPNISKAPVLFLLYFDLFKIIGFSLKVFCLICTNLAVFSSVLHLNMNVLSVAVFVYKSLINHATLETN